MISIPMTAEQAGNLAAAAISAIGRDVWYRCTYVDGELQVPDDLADSVSAIDPDAVSTSALIAYAADKRWQIETGGIVLGGVPIATDDRSKIMIMGARVAAAANPDWETVWHGADGQTYPLNATSMIAISDAVEAHVNSTFSTFAAVKSDIAAGDITTTAEIDAAFAAE